MNIPQLSLTWNLFELIKALIECLRQIAAADKKNLKSDANLELSNGKSLILTDSVTGARVSISVASGVVTVSTL